MNMEIWGHEFFGQDGRWVWFDLQTPRSGNFWLAGVELATGRRTWYGLRREEWSVHYNVSPDGTVFSGDGGGPGSVASRGGDGELAGIPDHAKELGLGGLRAGAAEEGEGAEGDGDDFFHDEGHKVKQPIEPNVCFLCNRNLFNRKCVRRRIFWYWVPASPD